MSQLQANNRWISRSEVQDLLGISNGKLSKLIAEKDIPYYLIGNQAKFTRELVEEYIENQLQS